MAGRASQDEGTALPKAAAVTSSFMDMWNRLKRLALVLGWGSWRRRNLLQRWRRRRVVGLDGRLECFDGELLLLRGVYLDPECVVEENQELCLRGGFLRVGQEPFALGAHPWLEKCLASLRPRETEVEASAVSGLTVLVRRHEWKNVYHILADIYWVFLTARFLGYEPRETSVLFVDKAPLGPLQWLWERSFASARLLTEVPAQDYSQLAICLENYDSPLSSCLGPAPPFLEEFSRHLRKPNQGREGLVTIVSRQGCAERSLRNEEELALCLHRRLPHCKVQLQRFEELDLEAQFDLISTTDLLIGAHGAGLTHCLFLPPTSAVLEIFPGFLQAFRFHFSNISHWRGLPYARWINFCSPDPAHPVAVPVEKIADLATRLWYRRAGELTTRKGSK